MRQTEKITVRKSYPRSRHNTARPTPLGTLLKEKREVMRLSQEMLAAKIGITRGFLSRIETGRHQRLNPMTLQRIAVTLSISCEDLYAITGYTLPDGLPDFIPYLRARHPGLPDEAIAELESYFRYILSKYGLSGQPSGSRSTQITTTK